MSIYGTGTGYSIIKYIKSIGLWQNINMLIYILLILNIGDRGPFIVVSLIYYLSYLAVSGVCPSKKTLIIGLTIGVVFAAFLGFTKNFRGNNDIFERIAVTWKESPFDDKTESVSPVTAELANSYACLPYVVDDIRSTGNYGYGKYQISAILSSIPFINGILGLPKPSAIYISHLIQGPFLSFGNGTNVIADFYLDGGVIGAFLGMFIFGFFVRRFEITLFCGRSSSLLMYCAAFYFSIHFVTIPRSNALLDFKYSVWLAIILYIYQRYFSSRTDRKVINRTA